MKETMETKWVWVDIKEICVKKDIRIQQRKYGQINKLVREIEATLDSEEDLRNPITLMRWEGKQVVKHGNHRLIAFKRKGFKKIKAYIEENTSEELIAESQLADNATHTPNSPASKEDWIKWLRKDMVRLEKVLGFSATKNSLVFRKALMEYIYEGNGGFIGKKVLLAPKTLGRYILEAVRLYSDSKISSYKTYDTADARSFAIECLPLREDVAIQPVRNETELVSASAGQAISNLLRNGQRTILVCYAESVANKNKIGIFRNEIVKKYREIQKSIKINGKPLYQGIYFLPQVLDGERSDDMETLIDAKNV